MCHAAHPKYRANQWLFYGETCLCAWYWYRALHVHACVVGRVPNSPLPLLRAHPTSRGCTQQGAGSNRRNQGLPAWRAVRGGASPHRGWETCPRCVCWPPRYPRLPSLTLPIALFATPSPSPFLSLPSCTHLVGWPQGVESPPKADLVPTPVLPVVPCGGQVSLAAPISLQSTWSPRVCWALGQCFLQVGA